MNKYNAQIGAGGTQYAYYHEEDESSFQLVSLKQVLIEIIRAYLFLSQTRDRQTKIFEYE